MIHHFNAQVDPQLEPRQLPLTYFSVIAEAGAATHALRAGKLPIFAERESIESDLKRDPKNAFVFANAPLFPANRIPPDDPTLYSSKDESFLATVGGVQVRLPFNHVGSVGRKTRLNLHGFLYDRSPTEFQIFEKAGAVGCTARFYDFFGKDGAGNPYWKSKAEVVIKQWLAAGKFYYQIIVRNVGYEPLPVLLASHPWYELSSLDETEVRIPASELACLTDDDARGDVLPDGRLMPVSGPLDFREGAGLKGKYIDHFWTGFTEPWMEIIDHRRKLRIRTVAESGMTGAQSYFPDGGAGARLPLEWQLGFANPGAFEKRGVRSEARVIPPGTRDEVRYQFRVEVFHLP